MSEARARVRGSTRRAALSLLVASRFEDFRACALWASAHGRTSLLICRARSEPPQNRHQQESCGHTRLFCWPVKTAVSIPDALFRAADRLARRLGLSRSELYAHALERFVDEGSAAEITARLDEVYASEDSCLDDDLVRAQRRAVRQGS